MRRDETDLFDHHSHRRHKEEAMEPSFRSSNKFEFAFNSMNFSDRVLKIEIVAEGAAETKSYAEGCSSSIADWARHRKRRREDTKKDHAAEFAVYKTDNIVNANMPDINGVAYEDPDGEAVAMIEESPSGDEPSGSSDFSRSMDCSPVLRVSEVYISSAILAAESPFFYKLFSNGMRESDQKHATLRISASEEAALMELLSFIYSGKLSCISAPLVLDVLMAADKFEVISCMRYISQLLSQSMTTEYALLFLELPSRVSMASIVQPLTHAAKEYLANKYQDLRESQDELMNFPLAGIEAILSSDILQAASEDAVYDFVLKWARGRYGNVEERREILGSCLVQLVRFSYMTSRKLWRVLKCNDLSEEIACKVVLEALVSKSADSAARQRARALLASRESYVLRWFVERAYKHRPVKVVEFELPHLQCIVYLDLRREDCAKLFPSGGVVSQAFYLGGQGFSLLAYCSTVDQPSQFCCFGLSLGMKKQQEEEEEEEEGTEGSVASLTVEFEFAARTRPAGDFVIVRSKYPKAYYTFTAGKTAGYKNLFAIPWDAFLAEDSLYFINGVLHLRAELTIKQQPQQPPR